MDCSQEEIAKGIAKTEKDTTQTQRRALTLDVERYQRYLDVADIGDDEKRAFIEALWTIIVNFVDLGFEVRPENPCGKLVDIEERATASVSGLVRSVEDPTTHELNANADASNDQREREES
ncbi:MAG: hypothetical protein AAFV54_01340 [Pseudomonadota bacterium]